MPGWSLADERLLRIQVGCALWLYYIEKSDCRFPLERARVSTTISVLGGVGLFLLGMTVMSSRSTIARGG